jgi:hypothetical protein
MTAAEAVAEQERPAARGRLELLRKSLHERHQELEKTREAIAALEREEDEAVALAARQAPRRRIFALGTPAQKAKEGREKLERKLAPLEREIAALVAELDAAERAAYAGELEQAIREAERLRQDVGAAWKRAAEVFLALHEAWIGLVEAAEALDGHYRDVTGSDAFAGCADETLKGGLKAAARLVGNPFPSDFAIFFEALCEAAFDPRRRSYREPNGERLDYDRFLITVIPDMRGQGRWPVFRGGQAERRHSFEKARVERRQAGR